MNRIGPVVLSLTLAAGSFDLAVADDRQVALLPIQDRAGDTNAMATAFGVLEEELGRRGHLVDSTTIRNSVRRLRIRNLDLADPEDLARLSRDLGVAWIVSATLHEAVRDVVPRTTLSTRVLDAGTGELAWAGFDAGSGLDRRGLLDLGVVTDLEGLVDITTRRILADLPTDSAASPPTEGNSHRAIESLGTVAIVPWAGLARSQASVSAEAVTELVRSSLLRLGVRLAQTNRVGRILRQGRVTWGEIDADSRETLRRSLAVDSILTGAVEIYEMGHGTLPRPRVAIAMRLIEAETGRVLWADGLERDGWDRWTVFDLGRIYSGGVMSMKMVSVLLERLLNNVDERNRR